MTDPCLNGNKTNILTGKAHRAISLLANLAPRKSHHHRASRKLGAIGAFFEDSVLGIIVQSSDAINDPSISQSIPEKKRCLRGIEEMIKLAKHHISNALPQVYPPITFVALC